MIDINNFKEQVNDLIFYLNDVKGNRLFLKLQKEKEAQKSIQENEEAFGAYIALQFLIIPFLRTRQISELLSRHLYGGLHIEDIDIRERIKKKLLFLDLSDRDNCKKELKNSLINNQERITQEVALDDGRKLSKTSEWIKDYSRQFKGKRGNTVGQAEYYSQSNFTRLSPEEQALLKKIFALYKFLDISSLTPGGFEDDLLIKDKDGKIKTTNKGQVVTLYSPAENKISANNNKNIAKKTENKKIESKNQLNSNQDKLAELQSIAAQYPEGGLERRAIEEEMKKLKVKSS